MSFRPGRVISNESDEEDLRPVASTSHLPDLPIIKTTTTKQLKRKIPELMIIEDEESESEEDAVVLEEEEDEEEEEEGDNEDDYLTKQDLIEEDEIELKNLEEEILKVDEQLLELQSFRNQIVRQKSKLSQKIDLHKSQLQEIKRPINTTHSNKSIIQSKGSTDYVNGKFHWDKHVKSVLKSVWKIDDFRLCQKEIISASLDNRDIVVVLRTGGGKSLTYQLPALITKGTSIVITPLISLMQDQTFNLKRQGVNAEMLNNGTSQADSKDIHARMIEGLEVKSSRKKGVKMENNNGEPEERQIKLVYVTPERIEKSKTFVNILQKLYDAGMLSRIIIDEAHCISSLGNDFRTSYKALGRLRTLFPLTPIIACTATAPPSVVVDMIKSLQMPRITSSSENALPNTTILFTSSLYRPNLHYSVLNKPTATVAVVQIIVDYILEKHEGHCGVIYCLSRSDTENVAKGIYDLSNGKIRCAVYHSGIDDAEKINIHRRWREGRIQLIVATNAFGLGIDAPDVRFVIHHSLAKSLESYYQESGRAGRDGQDSDCVILYRTADCTRLSTLTYADFNNGGKEKLYGMIEYAEDLITCRKIAFSKYFSNTHENKSAFEEGDKRDEACGHCDNCLRDSNSFEKIDITLQVYRALRILAGTKKSGAVPTITLAQACDLVRGLGGGKFGFQQSKGKGEGKVDINLEAGNKVTLSKEETESMLVSLLLKGYLFEQFHATAYTTISYLGLKPLATRFTRIEPEQFTVEDCTNKMFINVLVTNQGKGKKRKSSNGDNTKTSTVKKQKTDVKKVKVTKGKKKIEEIEIEEEEGKKYIEYDYEEEEKILRMEEDGSDEVELDQDGWQVFDKKKIVLKQGQSGKKKVVETLNLMDDSD